MKKVFLAALLCALVACSSGLSGTAVVSDPADGGSASNSLGGHPAKPQLSADLTSVKIEVVGKNLVVNFDVAGPVRDDVPSDTLQGPDWFLQLWKDKDAGAPAGIVGVVRRGTVALQDQNVTAGWKILACLGATSCDNDAKDAALSITGKNIHAVVPLADLPDLGKSFTWVAFSYWNETTDIKKSFSDWLPSGAEPPKNGSTPPGERATFPS